MNCRQCKRRLAAPGKRFCVTCGAIMRARVLEHQLALTRADLEAAKVCRPSKPVDGMELADAAIVRCRLCDTRFIPDSGHRCRRAYKQKAAA